MTEEQKALLSNLSPELIFDVVGANKGMTLKEMMDHDAKARSSGDMLYFPKELVGKIHSIAVFLGVLSASSYSEAVDRFLSEIREIEIGESFANMESIARSYDGSPEDSRRFGMYSELNKAYGKQLDRLDKRLAKHTEERKVDLLEKLVDKLSNSQLLKIKDNVQGALIDVRGKKDGE